MTQTKAIAKTVLYTSLVVIGIAGFLALPFQLSLSLLLAAVVYFFIALPIYEHVRKMDEPEWLRTPYPGQIIDLDALRKLPNRFL